MISFDKVVKKMWNLEGNIISIIDVSNITDPDFSKKDSVAKSSTYKTLYRLKACDIITPIRQGLYFVNNQKSTSIERIIEDNYWSIAKKILTQETGGEYFISGNKALEIYLKDFSLPRKLITYHPAGTKNIALSPDHTLSIRPINSGKKTSNKNLYTVLKKYTKTIEIDGIKLRIASLETSLLDALLIRDESDGIDQYLINKCIKRFGKTLDRKILWDLVAQKYITSINRLRELARDSGNTPLYELCLDIIKQEGGGCFITSKKD